MAKAHYPPEQFGQWFAGLRTTDLRCEPQELQSLTFSVLTPNVIEELNSRLALDHVNYLPRRHRLGRRRHSVWPSASWPQLKPGRAELTSDAVGPHAMKRGQLREGGSGLVSAD
jgi:hypothetical protein